MAVDEAKLNEFLGRAVGDLGAAMSATLILVGDRLGLYRELAKGPVRGVVAESGAGAVPDRSERAG